MSDCQSCGACCEGWSVPLERKEVGRIPERLIKETRLELVCCPVGWAVHEAQRAGWPLLMVEWALPVKQGGGAWQGA